MRYSLLCTRGEWARAYLMCAYEREINDRVSVINNNSIIELYIYRLYMYLHSTPQRNNADSEWAVLMVRINMSTVNDLDIVVEAATNQWVSFWLGNLI